jgi:hypothetical protein
MHLSKSDFKAARDCGTKLYYRKKHYPSLLEDNPYMRFLADGGYMVETIAKLMAPEGREVAFDETELAIEKTMEALKQENVTLFEATLRDGHMLARVDILEKRGNSFRIIEVKAKSFDSAADTPSPFRGKRGGIASDWKPYLEDVAFQTLVLSRVFPGTTITPCLCLVDKAGRCSIDMVFKKFSVTPPDPHGTTFSSKRPQIVYTGDVEALRKDPFIKVLDVSSEVDELLPDVRLIAARLVASIDGAEPVRIPPAIGLDCKACEYRIEDGRQSGFRECWGALADPEPHLLDLYRVDCLGKNGEIAASMIASGTCSLLDISEKDFRGATAERQSIQLTWSRNNKEYLAPGLKAQLGKCKYPLHFVDFETSRLAVPYHAGMRPYEQVAFQWSCHTIPRQGAELEHAEWINLEDAYPNFDFARSLRATIGTSGTVFVWSNFEKACLNEIRRQMARYGERDKSLAEWLDATVAHTGPIVDLCDLAKDHYFHPRMKGSLSIKWVLPAVWLEDEALRTHPWFSKYLQERGGQVLDPYEALQPLAFGDGESGETLDAVREGTGAMRTYQEMMYGLRSHDPQFRESQRRLLLQYCELDTAAMVMIWMHWTGEV